MTIDVLSCAESYFLQFMEAEDQISNMESSELCASNATTWKMEKVESS